MTRQTKPPAAHTPLRPLWLCRTCGLPWPCGQARLTLLREYHDDPETLGDHLAAAYQDALRDLTTLNPHDGPAPDDVHRRFLGWLRT